MYLGKYAFKDISYHFAFDEKRLYLTPFEEDSLKAFGLVTQQFAEGVYGWPSDPVEIVDRFIELKPLDSTYSIIAFPDSDAFHVSNRETGSLEVGIGSYLLIRRSQSLFSGIRLKSHYLNACYDIQENLEEVKLHGQKIKFTANASKPIQYSLSFQGKEIVCKFLHGSTYTTARGKQPLKLESFIEITFDPTQDYEFVVDLIFALRSWLQFCSQMNDMDFSEIDIIRIREIGEGEEEGRGFKESIGKASFPGAKQLPADLARKYFFPLGTNIQVEQHLMQDALDDNLAIEHLVPLDEKSQWSPARCIMVSASFDCEFAKLYPEGIVHKKKSAEAVEEINDMLEAKLNSVSDNSAMGRKLKQLKKILHTGDTFSSKLLQVYKDHKPIVDQVCPSSIACKKDFSSMADRIQKLRNDLAHGNRLEDFSFEVIDGMIMMEKLVMAVHLLNCGATDEVVLGYLSQMRW